MVRDAYDLYSIETSQGVFDIGGPIHDGGFTSINASGTIDLSYSGVSVDETTGDYILLDTVLPKGFEYLVYVVIEAVSSNSTNGTSITITLNGGYGDINTCASISRSTTTSYTGSGCWVLVNSDRRINIKNPYSQACRVNWSVTKYCRLGKNFDNPTTAVTWNVFKDTNIYNENQIYHWQDVAYGNGIYVIIGSRGYISTSTDGVNWAEPTSYSNINANSWAALTYGNGYFIALSSEGHISKSTDGVNWSAATQSSELGEKSWSRIVYGNGKFVALGQHGTISTSTNGSTWEPATTSSELGSRMWFGLAYGDGKFVALSSYGGITDGTGKKLGGYYSTSTDGNVWTSATQLSQLTVAQWFGLVYGDGRFVATSIQGPVITSDDGLDWGYANSNQNMKDVSDHNFWHGLTYDGKRYITVSSYGEIAISVIGCAQMIDIPNADSGLTYNDCNVAIYRDCDYNNGILTCKSENYAEIPRGRYNDATYQLTFTNADISNVNKKNQTPLHSEYWVTLDMNQNGLVAHNWETAQNEILIPLSSLSSNTTYQVQYETHKTKAQARYRVLNSYPSNITTKTIGSNNWLGIAYSNSLKKYVAVGSDGYFTTSTDDENWSTPSFINSAIKPDWTRIIFANGKFVVVGDNYVTTSIDGTTWTTPTQLSMYTGTYGYCLNYCNGKYFIVGQTTSSTTTGCIISSTDGITWSSATNVGSVLWASIVYGGDRYVMVGVKTSGSDAGIYSAVSTNGTSWTISSKINITGTIRKVIYANDKFYACGMNVIINSTDGLNWSGSNINNIGVIQDMIYTTDMFFAHSNQGLITSIDGTNWSTGTRVMLNINQIIHVDGYYMFVTDSGKIGKSSLCDWGNWSNWYSWTDNKRRLDADYPVRLGQSTYRAYHLIAPKGFNGSIDLNECYIKPFVSTYYYWSGWNETLGIEYEVYTSQSANVQSSSNIVFDMNLDELDGMAFSYNNSKYYIVNSETGRLICEMTRNSSNDIIMPEYYWNGTDGTSTEILDLALNDTMNNYWVSKSVIPGSVELDSNKQYVYSLSEYLPNDGNEYLVHTSASFGTSATNNVTASLKVNNDLGAVVKSYSAAEHTKCRTFLVGPVKSTDSLIYQVVGSSRNKIYVRISGYRKLGTMGRTLENKISNIETQENGYRINRQVGGWRLDGNWIPTILEISQGLVLNSSNYKQWIDVDLSSVLPYSDLQYEVLMSVELHSGATSPHELSIEFKSSVMGEAESSLTRTNTSAYQSTRDQVILPIGRDRKLSWYSYTNNTEINGSVWMYINAYRRIGDIGGK